jgi:glycosyltransferase involved in cell wall biosynthesis
MLHMCYFISDVDKSFTLEWMFKYLDRHKINITCIILRNEKTYLEEFLKERNITVIRLRCGKYRLPLNIFRSVLFLRKHKVQAVHCHLFEASMVGLLASYICRLKVRIHTRHNATIHHDYHPHAVKYDRLINRLSTDIISISDGVTKILVDLEQVPPGKITKIHHGFDFDHMNLMALAHYQDVKQKYHLEDSYFYIGVISRYMHFKGIQYIIPAFADVLKRIPNARLILANAYGPYNAEIKKLLEGLPFTSYLEIHFEENVYSLIKNFNIFVHVPIEMNTEAFGQVYIENMALGVPSVFTKSGIANEIVIDGENALTVPFRNAEKITEAITRLYSDPGLRKTLSENAVNMAREKFKIESMILKLEKVYGI